ncbi:MAG TPA: aspartate aminotransferase family protein [Gemmatimonadaceae bacterium]|jgi:L-2,4-diaminobutyrate decarboxylase|nr:aspartate aminotransferase family protein [Gemmatimonadaceae bacterium]
MERDAALPFLELVTRYFAQTSQTTGRVSSPLSPVELARRFAEPLPLAGMPLAAITERLEREVFGEMNRLAHPMYMGHQVSAPLPVAVWTEAVIAAMNQSVAVSEMSPSGTAVERTVIRWMCELVGWGRDAGGTFTSGGTEATFTALLAARAACMPRAWEEGVPTDAPVVICGGQAHYAIERAVAQLGLGTRRLIRIPAPNGHMDTGVLETRLAELHEAGIRVMAVVATAGTTATGSFDDLETIGTLCDARGIWLHVDGAHGASALLSATHRHRVSGIDRARSVAWDAHKMMLMPLSAGMLLVRDEQDLERAFAQEAPYLFHRGEGGRTPDQGTRSFLCSRRVDALKVWVALQRHGANGMAAFYDHLCAMARALYDVLGSRTDFTALHEPESNILCFRWHPDGVRDDDLLDTLNLALRERYNASGHGWITTTVLDGRRVLRVTVMNPRTQREHVQLLVDGLAEEGAGLLAGK